MAPTTIYPYLSYRDTAGTLRFLEEAFGVTTHIRWEDPDSAVQHAEVTFGEGAVMMGTADHPAAPLDGASVGQGIYVYVEDVDGHFARVQQVGGARIVYPRRTRRGERVAIGCSTRKATSGVSATTDSVRRTVLECPHY
jgi:uncharacterized glyoxalase superfamily protein PhnB